MRFSVVGVFVVAACAHQPPVAVEVIPSDNGYRVSLSNGPQQTLQMLDVDPNAVTLEPRDCFAWNVETMSAHTPLGPVQPVDGGGRFEGSASGHGTAWIPPRCRPVKFDVQQGPLSLTLNQRSFDVEASATRTRNVR